MPTAQGKRNGGKIIVEREHLVISSFCKFYKKKKTHKKQLTTNSLFEQTENHRGLLWANEWKENWIG